MLAKSFILLSLVYFVGAQMMSDPSMSSDAMNGMDMGGMSSGGMMTPWLHFALGDALWFKTWVPQNKGALAGAAIGLFLLAIVERWFASMRALMELHWRDQYVP
jgi:copper transporter 1